MHFAIFHLQWFCEAPMSGTITTVPVPDAPSMESIGGRRVWLRFEVWVSLAAACQTEKFTILDYRAFGGCCLFYFLCLASRGFSIAIHVSLCPCALSSPESLMTDDPDH